MSQRKIRHEMLAETLANIHQASPGCYGIRRVRAELVRGLGIKVGRDQVGLVMQRTGIRGVAGTRKCYVNREHLYHRRPRTTKLHSDRTESAVVHRHYRSPYSAATALMTLSMWR